jgi:hypothetical protein
MHLVQRSILIGATALLLLSGCDFASPWGASNSGSDYGATSVSGNSTGTGGKSGDGTGPVGVGGESTTQGADDNTVMAASSTSLVSVAVGASETVSVTFNSSDGRSVTGFGISGSLGTLLPPGWSGPVGPAGPGTFTCARVSTGSGCVLNLTYAPAAADSGTVTLTYIYIDTAGLSKVPGGTITIPYQAIAANNVVATASPSGQVNAAVGGMQSVSVTFTTDTGNATLDAAASGLSVTTDLTALPAGWTSAAPSFVGCPLVTSGNGCLLMLKFAPTASGSGTLTLNYTYTDDMGANRMGAIQIPYSTTGADTVTATTSPAGQITAAIMGGSQAVAVTFDTDDGKTASKLLVTTALGSLPAGWHSARGSFQCGSVSKGNGCQLMLTYAPTALANGTLTLNYAYDDDTGAAQTGTLDVPYEATTNDIVTATPTPIGQINAVVGNAAQAVTVVFTTEDGRLATGLQVTSDLAMLPTGWTSSANPVACTTLSSGSGCQLTLTYNPPSAAAGTLTLNYSYTNNANEMKTGTLAIPYRADDTIGATVSPLTITGSVAAAVPVSVNVTFATNDGAPAGPLSVTSDLATVLPAGWTGPASFTCATVSNGTPCQLDLTYVPTVIGNSSFLLSYSYTDNQGKPETGTVTVNYSATL